MCTGGVDSTSDVDSGPEVDNWVGIKLHSFCYLLLTCSFFRLNAAVVDAGSTLSVWAVQW